MANKLIFLLSLLFIVTIMAQKQASSAKITASQLQPNGNSQTVAARGQGTLKPEECKPKCTYRCSATSHKKPCMFFCQKCCATCLCVPSGTYGHKEECPCYNNWRTQEGKPKCP